jgi:hypothetical protein
MMGSGPAAELLLTGREAALCESGGVEGLVVLSVTASRTTAAATLIGCGRDAGTWQSRWGRNRLNRKMIREPPSDQRTGARVPNGYMSTRAGGNRPIAPDPNRP